MQKALRSVDGAYAAGRFLRLWIVAPDGTCMLRADVALDPIGHAARAVQALWGVADALNAAGGLHLLC